MLLNIEHRTHYKYSNPVDYTIQQLRLTPPEGYGQHVRHWEIRVNGNLHRAVDTFGNVAHTLVVDATHDELVIVASGEVETGIEMRSMHEPMPFQIYLRSTPLTTLNDDLEAFAEEFRVGTDMVGIQEIETLMKAIVKRVPYEKGSTDVATTAAKAFALGKGVCQDHVHIFITCCRALGVPARYVSGYLTHEAHAASHAWAEANIDYLGWVGFDPTNRACATDAYIRAATGLDYAEASPIRGVRSGGGVETMTVKVSFPSQQQQQSQ